MAGRGGGEGQGGRGTREGEGAMMGDGVGMFRTKFGPCERAVHPMRLEFGGRNDTYSCRQQLWVVWRDLTSEIILQKISRPQI
jgi:hypothetical protein